MTKPKTFRQKMHEVIYEADTPAGKFFDEFLIVCIILSIITVMLDSVTWLDQKHDRLFSILEWIFTIFFTMEYAARIYCVGKPIKYVTSFMGIIDLLSILPSYLSIFMSGTQFLMTIRTMRLIRIFRVFKLARYINEASYLMDALKAARPKITVFLIAVISLVIIIGTLMYQIEGGENGFTSIPKSIYWAIVTLTTVGYGDIAPRTIFGQFVASVVMILGYAIIAIPTGIVTSEIANARSNKTKISTQACPECSLEGHDLDAKFCKYCGTKL